MRCNGIPRVLTAAITVTREANSILDGEDKERPRTDHRIAIVREKCFRMRPQRLENHEMPIRWTNNKYRPIASTERNK